MGGMHVEAEITEVRDSGPARSKRFRVVLKGSE